MCVSIFSDVPVLSYRHTSMPCAYYRKQYRWGELLKSGKRMKWPETTREEMMSWDRMAIIRRFCEILVEAFVCISSSTGDMTCPNETSSRPCNCWYFPSYRQIPLYVSLSASLSLPVLFVIGWLIIIPSITPLITERCECISTVAGKK